MRRPMVSHDKIYRDPTALKPHVEALRAAGKTVVFGNGCFDLLHVGHIRYLTAARALGDALIVAVNTDGSMARIKPDRQPVAPEEERFEILAALEMVDFVVPLEEDTPAELLAVLQPQIQAKGTDYTLDRMPERGIVEGYGGRIEFVGGPKHHSTTDLLKTIRGLSDT